MDRIVNAINLLTQAIKGVRIYQAIAKAFYYISASAGTTLTVAGTYYIIAGTYGTYDESEEFSISSGVITYNGDDPLTCYVNISVCGTCDTNNVVMRLAPAINSSAITSLATQRKIATGADVGQLNGGGYFTLDKGDTLEAQVAGDSAGAVFTACQCLISITPIAK